MEKSIFHATEQGTPQALRVRWIVGMMEGPGDEGTTRDVYCDHNRPDELIESMHNRMPVIVQRTNYDRWLTPGDPERPPFDLLRPFPAEQMMAWR